MRAMTDSLDDVWATRDYPVLREVTRRIDAGEYNLLPENIAEAVGIDEATMTQATKALDRRGLVDGIRAAEAGIVRFTDVSADAYLLTGLHPNGDDALSSLISALQQAADQVGDEEERSRLRRAADGLMGVSRNIAASVVIAWISTQIPH